MNIIAVTQKGMNKTENEDRVVIGKNLIAEGRIRSNIDSGIIAVADGVGGNNAGAIASHFVAAHLTSAESVSLEMFSKINNELLRLSFSRPDYLNMATTLSGICMFNDKTFLFSIGNTRVYKLQGGKYLKQLTNDDTTLNYLLTIGQLAAEDAMRFDRKNEITACFGGGAEHLFKIKCGTIEPLISPFMMTSDGIHDYVSIDRMEDIISEHGISFTTCDLLVAAARAGGSHDDASIILGEM